MKYNYWTNFLLYQGSIKTQIKSYNIFITESIKNILSSIEFLYTFDRLKKSFSIS